VLFKVGLPLQGSRGGLAKPALPNFYLQNTHGGS
jgi:hypothetical protein